jgi:tetratricopeptide (TPR) repeat protein
MSDADLGLVERAAARGLIPADALDRARRECRGRAGEWLLDQKLLTQQQLSRLIEDEQPLLPRAAAKDSSWAVIIFIAVIACAMLFAILFYTSMRPPHMTHTPRLPASATPALDGARAMSAGNYSMAVVYFTQALSISPASADLYTSRAGAYHQLKNLGSALADAEVAVTLDPSNVQAHIVRAGILIDLGRAQDAVDDLEKLPPSPDRDSMLLPAKTLLDAEKKK